MTKAQLVDHIVREHPALLFPKRDGLVLYSKAELESTHARLHSDSANHAR